MTRRRRIKSEMSTNSAFAYSCFDCYVRTIFMSRYPLAIILVIIANSRKIEYDVVTLNSRLS